MKTLNTNSVGRMPLWQADIDFLQQGWKEVVTEIVRELGMEKKYFVITGCVPYNPSRNFLQMPAGWVWWNGRILPVRALAATDITSFTKPVVRLYNVTQNYIQDGARSFVKADNTAQYVTNVWQDDYLVPTIVERGATFNSGIRLGIGCWTLKDMLAHRKAEAESEWIMTSNGSLKYKRVGGRLVVLKGYAEAENSYNAVTTGLPAPLGGDVYIAVPNEPELYCRIKADGGMVLRGTDDQEPSLDGIMYLAETQYTDIDRNTIDDNPVE